MGVHQKQIELWVEPVELGRRIPEDHILRKLARAVDLSFVREEVAACYGRKGHISLDPVIIVKMMMMLFLDDVRSERELMRIIPLRIDYLWYLGYGLEDEVPNHSVLSKARKRRGTGVFESLFKETIRKCLEAGLIDGEKVHVDSSDIRANASKNSVVDIAFRETLGKLEEAEEGEEAGSKQGQARSRDGEVNRTKRSATDPEATLKGYGRGDSVPSYKNHRVVDDKAGVVSAMMTTASIVNEAHKLEELVEQHELNTGTEVRVAVTDCQYGTSENFIALAQRGIRTHMGDLRSRQSNHRLEGIFPTEEFHYERESDTYLCPAGNRLRYRHWNGRRNYAEYKASVTDCTHCPLRPQCTRAKAGRSVNRRPEQDILDKAREQSASAAGKTDRKRRQHFQERNFADAANLHGFKRARWRGLARQFVQDYLIAALQNLRILLRGTPKDTWASALALTNGLLGAFSLFSSLFASILLLPTAIPCTATPNSKKSNPYAL